MQLVTAYDAAGAVVRVEGRLDAEWAPHLADTLGDLLRSGVRSAVVDLAQVSYVSSAGARVLTTSAWDFAALRGELLVATPPQVVVDALGDAGLGDRVLRRLEEGLDGRVHETGVFGARGRYTQDWRAPTTPVSLGKYETSAREPGATLTCRLHGDPARVARGGIGAGDCHAVSFPEQLFGLGIGAIGEDFEDCGPRMGELLGAAGVVAYLPTDGALVPDYLVTLRGNAPHALVASGLMCEGRFSHLVRFSAAHGAAQVPLSELAAVCLDAAGADVAGIVVIAETAGLVGASRRRSPASEPGATRFALPELREWLSFSAEPVHAGATALIAGVIARSAGLPLLAHLRPLRYGSSLLGHLHAAVFSYSPVPQRTVAVQPVVAHLFANETLRALLHLLDDGRAGRGAGESRLVRGLAWTSPVAAVTPMPP